MPEIATLAIGVTAALTVGGVIVRPFRLPEWVFAVAGVTALVATGLVPVGRAMLDAASGTNVYLFLAGMMLIAETARREGLFDYLAAFAARLANGSPTRLFALVYGVGILVTVFLSNDATAVVLTPAVAAIARIANARDPIPYLLICAFVANAASFVLPISNPANLVVFAGGTPALAQWLSLFALPSVVAIGVTFAMLLFVNRRKLREPLGRAIGNPPLSAGGKVAAAGLVLAIMGMLSASALGASLGVPTAAAGLATLALVSIGRRSNPLPTLAGVSWSTLAFVAALFVIVGALQHVGLQAALVSVIERVTGQLGVRAGFVVGATLAVLTNFTNNLPLGLIAGGVVTTADVDPHIVHSVLIGIDLGPNFSVTGSLATMLWLLAVRREGIEFSAARFVKIGVVVTLPALVAGLLV